MDDPFEFPLLREHAFQSYVPVVGPLIGWTRRTLYRLTAKWGVWVVIEQQNQINQLVAKRLAELDSRLAELDSRLIDQDRDVTHIGRALAETNVKLNWLIRSMESMPGEVGSDDLPSPTWPGT